ncbi:unnamed protein product [Parnassius apollo]|uniref:(apollo) hypothetical protein n=1 Tax=Parnassius apollo TaxID=110799 RepID=A0A8S3XRD9_PARAO|nr:unnamed protein product [Parnassius apollo]
MAEEEPMPSTSSGYTGDMFINREMDFLSNDSVQDPHFELPNTAADSSTSSDISCRPGTDRRTNTPQAVEQSLKKKYLHHETGKEKCDTQVNKNDSTV